MSMQALRYEKTGSLDYLELTSVPVPTLEPGEALVKVHAAGINGSDSAGIHGWFNFVTVPRIPGRDFSGEVIQVAPSSGEAAEKWVGEEVWGTGSERGFSVDGSYAEYLKVPISSLSRKPKSLSHIRAASITLPWLCAWIAVETLAGVKKGENVLIIGARGGIGSAAAEICNERGAKVFGTYRSLTNINVPSFLTPIELGSDPSPPPPAPSDASHGSHDAPSAARTPIRDTLAPLNLINKIDVLLDCAGYEGPLNEALTLMTPSGRGRVVVMAVHRPDGLFNINLRAMYTKALTVKGLRSSMLGPGEVREVLDWLAGRLDGGAVKAPEEVRVVEMGKLEEVKGALKEVLTRSEKIRGVIVPKF